MPIGLRILTILSIGNIISTVFGVALVRFLSLNISFFPNVLTTETLINWLLPMATSVFVVVAIKKRTQQWYVLTCLIAAVTATNMIRATVLHPETILSNPGNSFYYLPYIYFSWYWIRMRDYFIKRTTVQRDSFGALDTLTKKFVVIWILLFLALLAYTSWTSTRNRMTLKLNMVKFGTILDGKSYKERLQYCSESVSISDKDICMYTAFSLTKNKENITAEDCNRMKEETFRFSCYAMAGTCNELKNETLATSCTSLSKIYQGNR